MSKLARVLRPGSTELPDCICGHEMTLSSAQATPNSPGSELRTYSCRSCGHELRLTVWTEATLTENSVVPGV
jgi:hypothetical protein